MSQRYAASWLTGNKIPGINTKILQECPERDNKNEQADKIDDVAGVCIDNYEQFVLSVIANEAE